LRRNDLNNLIWLKGTPTIMIGNTEDPNFEEHLKEGPYLVFDDAARDKYKNDSRVHFIGGHPVLRDAMTGLLKGFGADANAGGKAIMAYEQFERWGQHNFEYGTPARKVITISKPIIAAAFVLGGVALGAATLLNKFWNKNQED
jgi:hypothetical protein